MNVIRNFARAGGMGAVLAGVIVISLPNGFQTISFNNSPVTHVTSNFTAQVDDLVAVRGEHILKTSRGIRYLPGDPNTATITVVK